MSRAAVAAAILAAGLLAWPGVEAARADAAQVTVVSPGGNQQTLALGALAGGEDVSGRSYVLRSGADESTRTVTGFSLAKVLDAAGADPYGFSYLEAQRPAGGSVLLSRHQALDPGAFPDGPPVVYATAAGTGFLRPSSGAEDLNASDFFEAPQGVTIVLRKGSPLRVRARASTVRARPGREVSFEAIVEQAGAGERLTYSWYFDDGNSARGAEVRHRFAERGSYDVVVGVTTPGDSAGASAVVTVQVGAPLAGPDRKGGGTSKDANAPDHGAATGTDETGTSPPGADTSSATPPPSVSSHLCPHSGQKCELTPGGKHRKRRPRTPEAAQGEPVSGLLLTGADVSPPKPPAPTAAARTGKLSDGGGGGLSDTALGALGALGLLGLGALGEIRGLGSLLPRRL